MQVVQRRIERLTSAGRDVILAGDLNIAPRLEDHCDYCNAPPGVQANFLNRRPDRAWFVRALDSKLLCDVFR